MEHIRLGHNKRKPISCPMGGECYDDKNCSLTICLEKNEQSEIDAEVDRVRANAATDCAPAEP
jgi:hypothetical protein